MRGCKNTDSFAISKTNEMGGGVIICKECLKEALNAADNYPIDEVITKKDTPPPPLFFNTPSDAETLNSISTETKDKNEEKSKNDETEKTIQCSRCGKTFKNIAGLKKHEQSCGKTAENS